jgi:hypothetical protein
MAKEFLRACARFGVGDCSVCGAPREPDCSALYRAIENVFGAVIKTLSDCVVNHALHQTQIFIDSETIHRRLGGDQGGLCVPPVAWLGWPRPGQ